MIEFTRPALAAGGVAAALLPLVLHLIARRPRERVALPTARFLAVDERVAVRVRRWPTDLLLLALRMLLLVLAGVGLAGLAWHPERGGTAEVVLLDRSRAMKGGDAWRDAVGEARRRLLGADGEPRGHLVLFDSAAVHLPARRLTAATFDSLAASRPGEAPANYVQAVRALADVGRGLGGYDSARATLLTVPTREGWRPGLAAVRRAAWPGAVEIPAITPPGWAAPAPVRADVPRRGAAIVVGNPADGIYVTAALQATGWTVIRGWPDESAGDTVRLIVVLAAPSADAARRIEERVRGGASLLASPGPGALASLLPWRGTRGDGTVRGTIWFGPELWLEGATAGLGGRPAEGATTLAAWDDGRPAAAAARVGRGCVVVLAAPLEGGRVPMAADYPRALDRLARGCDADAASGAAPGGRLPLDPGGVALLRLAERPTDVAASALAGPGGGTPLGRWVLAAALAVALAETALAYRGPGRRAA